MGITLIKKNIKLTQLHTYAAKMAEQLSNTHYVSTIQAIHAI